MKKEKCISEKKYDKNKKKNSKKKKGYEKNKIVQYKERSNVDMSKQSCNNKDIVNMLLKIISVLGGAGLLYPVVQGLLQLPYQIKCADFYSIPYRYFSLDLQKEIAVLLFMVVALCSALGYKNLLRIFVKGYENQDKLIKLAYYLIDIYIGLAFSYAVLSGFMAMLKQIEVRSIILPDWFVIFINNNINTIISIIIVSAIITVVGFNNINLVRTVKSCIIKNLICVIISSSGMLSVAIFLASSIFCLNSDVSNKSRYETTVIDSRDYAVLNYKDGKILLAEYYEDDKKTIIFTNTYMVVECEGKEIVYKDWKTIPIIETDMKKEEYVSIQ